MNKISLFKDLARTGFHSSIITTYSVDAAFYDSSVQQRLRIYGCENNILMADAAMLQRAIAETPECFARAGSLYAVVPVSTPGCFHPKLNIRLGTDSGCVTIGSANATAAGWGSNREIIGNLEWWRKQSDGNETAMRALLRKAFDFAAHWLGASASASIQHKLMIIERDAAWLFDAEANSGPVTLADQTLVDLLCERAAGDTGILEQLVQLVDGAPVRRLVVLSPYWDIRLDALRALQTTLNPEETVVALSSQRPEFPVSAVRALAPTQFASVFDGGDRRFVHAKVFLIETEEFDHLLFGSANCSDEALGLVGRSATNAECSIYRRLPAGAGLALLGLDISNRIPPEELVQSPRPSKPTKIPGFPPGIIEAAGPKITWHPHPSLRGERNAKLKIGEEEYSLASSRDGLQIARLSARPIFPLIARIELADGRLSSAVLVNDELKLAQAAPGVGDRRLRAAFAKIELDQTDLLELASLASIIFSSPASPAASQKAVRRHKGGIKALNQDDDRTNEDGTDYESPESFRNAMEGQSPARGESQYFNFDSPDAVNLLRIVLRGIRRNDREIEVDDDISIGDDETQGDSDIQRPPPPVETERKSQKTHTSKEAETRRFDILRAMDSFDSYLERLISDTKEPPRKLSAETCFILRLMVHAAKNPIEVAEGESRLQIYPLDLVPQANDRERNFAIRAGRMLQRLWLGTKSQPALLSRITIGRNHDELPYDCFALVVFSRWAMARANIAMQETGNRDLAGMLQRTALKVWRASLDWPLVDKNAEIALVRRLEEAIGIETTETDRLIQHYRQIDLLLQAPLEKAA